MSAPRLLVATLALALAVLLAPPRTRSAPAPPPRKGAEQLQHLVPVRSGPTDSAAARTAPTNTAYVRIRIGPYLGWDRTLTLDNGRVEAVVVPAVGRIMEFRFTGQDSPFWEDPALRGRTPDPASSEWGNFGGDKTWPAPQSDWDKVTPRAWPPPIAFDSMPVEAFVRRDMLVLVSPVDPHFGIRTERVIQLGRDTPEMTVTTTYEKVSGNPVRVGVWIITQLDDPVAVFVPIPANSRYPEGYNRQSGDILPAGLAIQRPLLALRRDPAKSTKIGTDSDRLLWVGAREMVLIGSPRVPGADYPDQQSSAEIYTNPDPKSYVELEMLGPLQELKPGDRLSQTNTYRLFPRRNPDPATDARAVLFDH